MKTMIKKLFLLAIIFLTPNLVQAASSCTYEQQAELNDIVANVKANYEPKEILDGKAYAIYEEPDANGNYPEVDHYVHGFEISILNITEDIYVKVTNNVDDQTYTFYNKDTKDGIATFETKESSELVTYTIEVYANKYSCAGESFRKLTVTTPIFNIYSDMDECIGFEDFYYCQKYLSSENIPAYDFVEQLENFVEEKEKKKEEEEKKNKSFFEKIKEFYSNNKLIINIVGGVVIASGVTTTAILVKKKRSRVL